MRQRFCLTIPVMILSALCTVAGWAQTPNPTSEEGQTIFAPSSDCIACHSNISAASGEDISIGYSWRSSMMANSGRDPYWHAGVRRESIDHPEAQAAIEDKCSTCHMPMMRFLAAHNGGTGKVFDTLENRADHPLGMDGVSCTVCHQIRPDNFGEHESFDGGFEIDTATPSEQRAIFGPHDVDAGHERLMNSASAFVPTQSDHMKQAELCGTCHTLYTEALGPNGEVVGSLPEQMPYQEWLHSDFRTTQTCQDCHMPALEEDAPVTSVLGVPRPAFSRHTFRGANAFMVRLLNRHRDELGVTALPQEMSAGAERTIHFLATESARLTIGSVARNASTLDFTVAVTNLGGHKLPTAYPSRRAWLHVTVRDRSGAMVFESGALRADGSIVGNDNDDDQYRFEPHYREITAPEQVQIYEPVLADPNDRLTTGLLTAVRYIKDNRLLPRGFDKTTADADVGVYGDAADDADFIAGSDSVRYRLDVGNANGPLAIDVELMYQSIGFRWAENLKAYDAPEPRRFVRYYAEAAGESGMLLATSSFITTR